MPAPSPLEQRLLAKLRKEPAGCWIFTGARDKKGYGRIGTGRRVLVAHRAAYELWVALIPIGMQVCHHCDNPPCCRPEHLFAARPAENTADMITKGRDRLTLAPLGERQGQSKLTARQVLEIRRRYVPGYGNQVALAREFGVTPSNIYRIVARDNWRHLSSGSQAG